MDLVTTGVPKTTSSVSALNTAVDLTHAVKDYTCFDYKCLFIDIVATVCDLIEGISAFAPGNIRKKVFEATTNTLCFYKTLCNKCTETNILGYK